MRIHSSSLNISAASHSRKSSGASSNAQKPDILPVSSIAETEKPRQPSIRSGRPVESVAASVFSGNNLVASAYKPALDGRIAHALSAYQQQLDFFQQSLNNLPIEGIDFYV